MTAARIKIPLLMLTIVIVAVISALCGSLLAQDAWLKGRVTDPAGNNLPRANVLLLDHGQLVGRATTNENGRFQIALPSARQSSTEPLGVKGEASGFRPVERPVVAGRDGEFEITVKLTQLLSREENVTVTADLNETDVLSPDPAEKVFVRQDLLDANPGRPGAPVSIPGYPIETASSGIKAPQYFAPGVAGDHGEPIAQYIAVGSYLVPNNLSANAHGNGYADPNIFIPELLESVQVDGGAFNVREGNHALNLAAVYGFRSHLDPFITVTGDDRDIDVVTGFSPSPESFLPLEASSGTGLLSRLEHAKQNKLNGQRIFRLGNHELTLLGIGYYGFSFVPSFIPIFFPNPDDNTH